MSSIIKTGCAPSNTPDGKYFLQTDQACYAELKRGRTYIMTAQEEAKVSHYVIIANADFTVTFNGDSDLIQVGRANNAIVMNVHRACRIDFVQGGNLEFKEGTADLSSRITMGPNASGNVLVADSLPQQGDFAGQICSLTTGATYVWTGSEWSSTAGSSTLPTPTSSNVGYGLRSDGSSWVACKEMRTRVGHQNTTTSTDTYLIPLFTVSSSAVCHFGADIQMGYHGLVSIKGHIEVTRTIQSGSTQILPSLTSWTLISNNRNSTWGTKLIPSLFYSTESGVQTWYLGCKSLGTYGTHYTMWNIVHDYDITLTSSEEIVTKSTETEVSINQYRTVPVSTAANQMLVSDGNGGWKVLDAGAVGTTLKMTSDGPAWST